MHLDANEQITLMTEDGSEYDVTRKDWGYYATPSLNSRLQNFSLRGVLTKNRNDKFFVMLVQAGHEDGFNQYLEEEKIEVIAWLDTNEALRKLEGALGADVHTTA